MLNLLGGGGNKGNQLIQTGGALNSLSGTLTPLFVGEMCIRDSFNAALLEAAFMTGLERNADIVHMATYAPLFAHVEGWQWRPDMIWFDTVSYTHLVKLVSRWQRSIGVCARLTEVLAILVGIHS